VAWSSKPLIGRRGGLVNRIADTKFAYYPLEKLCYVINTYTRDAIGRMKAAQKSA
jgi:hypothetical protein